MTYRINPAEINGTLTSTGISHAAGPYNFRNGRSIQGVVLSGESTNTTDKIALWACAPGATPGTNTCFVLVAATATPFLVDVPLGGSFDLYVVPDTNTGTLKYRLQRWESNTAP
jgi:hypothetical protein